ncbi:MAG: nuclear transport factor 2 family protein [Candidatus Firestonebacteria bacterium]
MFKRNNFSSLLVAILISGILLSCNSKISNKEKAVAVLKSLQTKDKSIAMEYISGETYIQHNLGARDGREGFLRLFEIPNVEFKVNTVRVFEDGDFVFTHTEYDFFGPKVGFDIFRFKDGKIVEHWDNLQEIVTKTVSGRSQIDGPTQVADLDKTEENKKIVKDFVNDVLFGKNPKKITDYISTEKYYQHNPGVADGLDGLSNALTELAKAGMPMTYSKNYRVLGEGNFVLTQSEGTFMKKHVAFYDLFRIEKGKIVEHWDTIEEIPVKDTWKNENGKF